MEEIWPDYPTDEDYFGTGRILGKINKRKSLSKEAFFLFTFEYY
jgi:hypothetical protein